jgi:hypothetical protein
MIEEIIDIHKEHGQLSWMRALCSIVILTGCTAILLQLLLVIIFCIVYKDLSVLQHVEWMQPITLIGIALTGKAVQKKIENGKSK